MKALKIILAIVLVLVAIVVVLAFTAPTDFQMERSTEIDAPRGVVWDNVHSLKAFDQWSPWRDKDPNATFEWEGTEGEIGEKYSWDGNEEVGKGSEELITTDPMNKVETKLNFYEPMESEATSFINLEDAGEDKTKVTWGFKTEFPRPFNIMGLFMDMESEMEGDFNEGLKRLKERSEKQAAEAKEMMSPAFEIKDEQLDEMYYVGTRKTVKWDSIQSFYMKNLPKAYSAAQQNGWEMAGPASGIYYTWDTVNKQTDMAAVIPVKNAPKNAAGLKVFTVPAGKSMVIDYYGNYDKMMDAHMALGAKAQQEGHDSILVIEEYVSDPQTEPDTSKWLTRIHYRIQ